MDSWVKDEGPQNDDSKVSTHIYGLANGKEVGSI